MLNEQNRKNLYLLVHLRDYKLISLPKAFTFKSRLRLVITTYNIDSKFK